MIVNDAIFFSVVPVLRTYLQTPWISLQERALSKLDSFTILLATHIYSRLPACLVAFV